MTIFEATLASEIMGNSAVASIAGDRIYPLRLPANPTLPAATYRLISSPRVLTQQGAKMTRPRYRWDCWALVYDDAVALAVAIAKASGTSFNGWVDEEMDHQEEETGLFRRRLETLAWTDAEEAT